MTRKNKKLEKIKKENARFEKETPYNFCDRWCERCPHEKQMRCKLYLDELEQKLTCIAHGKEPNDPEITAEVMKQQFKSLEDSIEEFAEENEIVFDDIDDEDFEQLKRHDEFVKNIPLNKTAKQYRKKAYEFLKNTFYKKDKINRKLTYDFETISWYHTLLPVKLHRALSGLHEPIDEDEFGLYDAVAQFEICKKAIRESIKALQKISHHFPAFRTEILELSALLHNIYSRIEVLEESI